MGLSGNLTIAGSFPAYRTSIIRVPVLTSKVRPNGRESAKIMSKKRDE